MKRTASAKSDGKSSTGSNATRQRYPYYVLCIDPDGSPVTVQFGKVYQVIKPEPGDREMGMIRVIDEEGEDYLYSPDMFVPLDLPPKAKKAMATAATS